MSRAHFLVHHNAGKRDVMCNLPIVRCHHGINTIYVELMSKDGHMSRHTYTFIGDECLISYCGDYHTVGQIHVHPIGMIGSHKIDFDIRQLSHKMWYVVRALLATHRKLSFL